MVQNVTIPKKESFFNTNFLLSFLIYVISRLHPFFSNGFRKYYSLQPKVYSLSILSKKDQFLPILSIIFTGTVSTVLGGLVLIYLTSKPESSTEERQISPPPFRFRLKERFDEWAGEQSSSIKQLYGENLGKLVIYSRLYVIISTALTYLIAIIMVIKQKMVGDYYDDIMKKKPFLKYVDIAGAVFLINCVVSVPVFSVIEIVSAIMITIRG